MTAKEKAEELGKYIDYVDIDDAREFAQIPKTQINEIRVPLSKEQYKLYKLLQKNNKTIKNIVKQKRLETLKEDELSTTFNQLVEARKLMNNIASLKPGVNIDDGVEQTPKTKKLFDDMHEHLKNTPDGQVVLLTNLIKGGADTLEAGLKHRNIPYGKFVGKGRLDTTEESRQQDVRDYLKGKKRAMIISGAGAEGVSLGNTT